MSDIKKYSIVKWRGELYVITDFQHVNPGKGSGFTKFKLKNVKTGKVLEETLKTGEAGLEDADTEHHNMQYLYNAGEAYYFMDNNTYEQVSLNAEALGDQAKYLKEDLEVIALFYEDAPITIQLPKKIEYKVVEAPEGVKGDSASGSVTKRVVLENGLNIPAPLFIKEGDNIKINTETGEYVERA